MTTTLVISDPHTPFMHPNAIPFLKDLKKTFQPDHVVCVGDLLDCYLFSSFSHDPDALSAKEEWESAIEQLKPLYKLFPRLDCCIGNHEMRHLKRGLEAGLPSWLFREVRDIIKAPEGWKFGHHFNIDGVRYTHGEEVSGRNALVNLLQIYRQNVVIGHLHSVAGVTYLNNGINQCWAMATGCMVDVDAYAFQYGKNSKDKPVIGCGVVIDGVPSFIPM